VGIQSIRSFRSDVLLWNDAKPDWDEADLGV